MRVLLIRHAEAVEPGQAAAGGLSDQQRPLTAEGRRRLVRTARQLRVMEPQVAVLLASPLERARQSAEIVAQTYRMPVMTNELLRPGTPTASLNGALDSFAAARAPLVLVGHEPDLGNLAGWWLCGQAARQVRFGKGSVACLEFSGPPAPGSGRLRYLLPAISGPR